jgi:sec-independent protein translocase protein TatC
VTFERLQSAMEWLWQPAPYTAYPWAAIVGLVLGLLVFGFGTYFFLLPRFLYWWADESPRPGEDERGVSTEELSLIEHLIELRNRLLRAVIALALTTAVAFPFFQYWFLIAIRPILGRGNCPPELPTIAEVQTERFRACLQAITPTELLFSYFQVTLVVGLILAMPVIAYQVWAYIAPGLTRKERRYVVALVPGATLSFIAGVMFAYYLLLPPALAFLLGFSNAWVEVTPTVSSYINFIARLLIAIGVVFQLPLALFFMAKVRIINPKILGSIRRYVIVGAFIVAAVVTPTPDPFNQILVVIPILVLYELGALLARFA